MTAVVQVETVMSPLSAGVCGGASNMQFITSNPSPISIKKLQHRDGADDLKKFCQQASLPTTSPSAEDDDAATSIAETESIVRNIASYLTLADVTTPEAVQDADDASCAASWVGGSGAIYWDEASCLTTDTNQSRKNATKRGKSSAAKDSSSSSAKVPSVAETLKKQEQEERVRDRQAKEMLAAAIFHQADTLRNVCIQAGYDVKKRPGKGRHAAVAARLREKYSASDLTASSAAVPHFESHLMHTLLDNVPLSVVMDAVEATKGLGGSVVSGVASPSKAILAALNSVVVNMWGTLSSFNLFLLFDVMVSVQINTLPPGPTSLDQRAAALSRFEERRRAGGGASTKCDRGSTVPTCVSTASRKSSSSVASATIETKKSSRSKKSSKIQESEQTKSSCRSSSHKSSKSRTEASSKKSVASTKSKGSTAAEISMQESEAKSNAAASTCGSKAKPDKRSPSLKSADSSKSISLEGAESSPSSAEETSSLRRKVQNRGHAGSQRRTYSRRNQQERRPSFDSLSVDLHDLCDDGVQVESAVEKAVDDKTIRLVSWNVDILTRMLKQIALRRKAVGSDSVPFRDPEDNYGARGGMVIAEVKEVITLPRFEKRVTKSFEETDSLELHPDVVDQLRDYVATIASLYRDNPFHNFEHATHVAMSVGMLLSRIVAPDEKVYDEEADEKIASILHDHTYGITSDPLTQFACIFSALIHDVDHTGVPNVTLVKEDLPIAQEYNYKSIAEQNSVDIAWGLLMGPEYRALRSAIYTDVAEMDRFRQLVVNSVMATDIMDKEANNFRKARWEKAFKFDESTSSTCDENLKSVNRKATIVIEHVIQASDVAHTMQHWRVYTRWNERLFEELYRSYKQGRSDKDPSVNWYQGEVGFFDFYIIPLATKLKTCGVFGELSDQYLKAATENRRLWVANGKQRVQDMVEKYSR